MHQGVPGLEVSQVKLFVYTVKIDLCPTVRPIAYMLGLPLHYLVMRAIPAACSFSKCMFRGCRTLACLIN